MNGLLGSPVQIESLSSNVFNYYLSLYGNIKKHECLGLCMQEHAFVIRKKEVLNRWLHLLKTLASDQRIYISEISILESTRVISMANRSIWEQDSTFERLIFVSFTEIADFWVSSVFSSHRSSFLCPDKIRNYSNNILFGTVQSLFFFFFCILGILGIIGDILCCSIPLFLYYCDSRSNWRYLMLF